MTAGGAALRIFIDGASRGNPGEAGFGVHVEAEDGSAIAGLYGYLGRATNNVAEYEAEPDGRLSFFRFSLGSCTPTPHRMPDVESCLNGQVPTA